MPKKYSIETLPEPNNTSISFKALPAHKAAAIRFTGRMNARLFERKEKELRSSLESGARGGRNRSVMLLPAGSPGKPPKAPARCYTRRVVPLLLLLAAGLCAGPGAGAAAAQTAEKQRILSITAEQLSGGIVSELTWVDGVLTVQGAFVLPSGEIKSEYFVVPDDGTEIRKLAGPTAAAEAYWRRKANRVSPTGLGRITSASDSKMPYPAWSDDGRVIAVAERKDGGRRWDISIVHLPEALRTRPPSL